MNRKIIFLLPVAYPTAKAYGVSIGRTVKALNLKGSEAEIWAHSTSDFDQFGNQIIQIGKSNPTRLSTCLSSRFKFVRTLAFFSLNLQTTKNSTRNIQEANSESTLIVVRELVLAVFLIFRPKVKRILIELHQFPTFKTELITRMLSYSTRIELATISDQHKILWEKRIGNKEISLTPVGVSLEFFTAPKGKVFDKIRIVYVGKATSGGHDNGLLELIPSLKCIQRRFPKSVITLVGLEEDFWVKLKKLALNENLDLGRIKYYPHVPHSEVPKFLINQDFGLIPYPSNRYHNSRFPIKALEYAAMGLILLVRANSSNTPILPEKVANYFSAENESSLSDVIQDLIADPERLVNSVKFAERWALDYTYEARALQFEKILLR